MNLQSIFIDDLSEDTTTIPYQIEDFLGQDSQILPDDLFFERVYSFFCGKYHVFFSKST